MIFCQSNSCLWGHLNRGSGSWRKPFLMGYVLLFKWLWFYILVYYGLKIAQDSIECDILFQGSCGLKMKPLPFMGVICIVMLFIVYRTTNYQYRQTEVCCNSHLFAYWISGSGNWTDLPFSFLCHYTKSWKNDYKLVKVLSYSVLTWVSLFQVLLELWKFCLVWYASFPCAKFLTLFVSLSCQLESRLNPFYTLMVTILMTIILCHTSSSWLIPFK